MACGCKRLTAPKKYANCTASPKHRVEEVTYQHCLDVNGLSCTGYEDVNLAMTTVRTPGSICPKC
jgi:hypothetical protein